MLKIINFFLIDELLLQRFGTSEISTHKELKHKLFVKQIYLNFIFLVLS